jgi:hypothetical protein
MAALSDNLGLPRRSRLSAHIVGYAPTIESVFIRQSPDSVFGKLWRAMNHGDIS